MPKEAAGLLTPVKDNDWKGLNIALRQIYDRLDSLSGARGRWQHRDDIDFNQHQAINVTRILLGKNARFGIYFGNGVPTILAAKGSLYLRTDGTTIADRAYINKDGAKAWAAIKTDV